MRRVFGTITGCTSAFLTFWFLRLMVVTSFLTETRPGGHGAYIGAVVFPVLALAFGWITIRLWR